jgi:hypothetical protein
MGVEIPNFARGLVVFELQGSHGSVLLGLSQASLKAVSNPLETKRFCLVVTSSDGQNCCEFFQASL